MIPPGEKFKPPAERPVSRDRAMTFDYIANSRDFMAERFKDDQEARKSVDKAIDLLAVADEKHHQEVGYHNPDHILSMARNSLIALDNIRAARPEIAFPEGFDKIMTLATILHDMGYYSRDPQFGTMKVDHETRSQEYIVEHAVKLGLSEEEIRSAQIMMEGTRFATSLLHINDIYNPEDTKLSSSEQSEILSQYKIGKKSLAELDDGERAALLGASIIGVLDVIGANDTYLARVIKLQEEFATDKKILRGYLEKTMTGDINEATIKAAADEGNQAALEYGKIPLAPTGLDQVKNSKSFFQFVTPQRIAKTGLVAIDDEGMVTPAGSLMGEEEDGIVAVARANHDKIYRYFDEGIVPDEVKHLNLSPNPK